MKHFYLPDHSLQQPLLVLGVVRAHAELLPLHLEVVVAALEGLLGPGCKTEPRRVLPGQESGKVGLDHVNLGRDGDAERPVELGVVLDGLDMVPLNEHAKAGHYNIVEGLHGLDEPKHLDLQLSREFLHGRSQQPTTSYT